MTLLTAASALVAVLLGQYIIYYRRQRAQLDELVAILERINGLDRVYVDEAWSMLHEEENARGNVPYETVDGDAPLADLPYKGAKVWRLRNKLEDAYVKNYSNLSDGTRGKIESIIGSIDGLSKAQIQGGTPHPEGIHDGILRASRDALEEIHSNPYLNVTVFILIQLRKYFG